MPSHRIEYLDIAKGIGMILVYIGHCRIPGDNPLFQWIYSFHMPLFFFISGLLFKRRDFSLILQNKVIGLLIPYVLFSIVNYLIDLFTHVYQISFIGVLLYGWGLNPMWFIPILFAIEIIHGIICCSKVSWLKHLTIFFVLCIFVIKVTTNVYAPYAVSELPWFYICFLTGYFLKNRILELICKYSNLWIIMFIFHFLFLFYVVLPYNDDYRVQDNDLLSYVSRYILGILGSIATLMFSKYIEKVKGNNILAWIGKNSIVLLCTHKIFYDVLYMYNPQSFLNGGFNHIVVIFLCVACIFLYNRFINPQILLLKSKVSKNK